MKTTILKNGDILKTYGIHEDVRHRQIVHAHIYNNNLIESEKEFIDFNHFDDDIKLLRSFNNSDIIET